MEKIPVFDVLDKLCLGMSAIFVNQQHALLEKGRGHSPICM